MTNNKSQVWEIEQINKIAVFLKLLYTDLKNSAKTPMAAQKLKMAGLDYVYWEAVKDLNILRLTGKGKSQIGYWYGPSPEIELSEKVLARVRLIWANQKQRERDRDAAGISGRKLIPITIRKKHNSGTIFLALEQLYNTQPHFGYTDIEINEKTVKHELPENFLLSVIELGFLQKVNDKYKFTQPTQELADILYDELFSGRKRTRAEMYNDVKNCMDKLWNICKNKQTITSTEVNDILEKMKFNSNVSTKIRKTCLERVPTGIRGIVNYKWGTANAPDLDLAISVYHVNDNTVINKNIVNQVRLQQESKIAQHEKSEISTSVNISNPTMESKEISANDNNIESSLRAKLKKLQEEELALFTRLDQIKEEQLAFEKVLEVMSL